MDRHRIHWTRRILALLTIGPAAAAWVLIALAVDGPTVADMPDEPCWQNELRSALVELDPEGEMPLVVSEIDGAWGRTILSSGLVRIDPDVPCGQVRGVVAHEWAHWRQHERYGDRQAAEDALGDIERAADCVAAQVSASERPYLGTRDCTPAEVQAAEATLRGTS